MTGIGPVPQPRVELSGFDVEQHLPLLRKWLVRPHVMRWWGQPAEALAWARRPEPGGHQVLITESGHPVGYLRWQHPTRAELDEAGLHEIPESEIDIDLLIGEPDALGRGIGPCALQLLLERVWRDPRVPMVGLCTSVENKAAQRAFEKAGFTRRRVFDDPGGGPCWLFVAERPSGTLRA